MLDGGDGSGKATQTKRLSEKILHAGYKVRTFEFPRYGEPSARAVEEYLSGAKGPNPQNINPYLASTYYSEDRHFAAPEIIEAQKSVDFLIIDRYASANMGHQGGKIKDREERERFFKWVENFEYNILGIPKEDHTIYLHVPPKENQALVEERGEKQDIHEKSEEHLIGAEAAFKHAAETRNWIYVECMNEEGKMRSIEDIADIIWIELGIIPK